MSGHKIWLLLVGINFYPEEAQRLHGTVNDVRDIELGLKECYKEINVTKLLASVTGEPGQTAPPENKHLWPTYDNFTGKLKYITQEASPNDIAWIHYSGHGTLHPTASKAGYQEDYGTDAALVLLEPGARRGVRYLRGIELARLLDDMAKKGIKLTVMLDSCHSGSISRREDSRIRGIPWSVDVDSEFPLHVPVLPRSLVSEKKIFRDTATTSHWLLHPQGYTLLAACGPHERAKEILLKEKQQYHGALSHLICKALNFCAQNQIQDVTHELIYRHVCANMFKVAEQHPILIGTENTTLLGAEVVRQNARSTFEIIKVPTDQEIWLNAGLIHGVCTEDEYGIYTHAEAKEPVTRIIITDVEAVRSIAKPTSTIRLDEYGLQIKVGYRAILTKLAQPRAYVKLFSGVDSSWEEILKESVWLQRLPSDKPAPDVPCFSVVKPDSHQYTILDFKKDAILNLPPLISSDPCISNQMFTILEHLSKYTFVQALDNRRTNSLTESDFTITVNAQADHINLNKFKSSITVPHESKVKIEFHNLTQEVLYFTVLNLTPFRRIKRLYPAHKEYQSVMPRDPQKVLPKEMSSIAPPGVVRLVPRVTVPARLRSQQQGSVSAEDILKFIVSTYPVRGTKSMELPDLWDAVEHNMAAVRAGDETFGASVQKSLVEKSKGPGQPGGDKTMIKWACQSVTIRTVLETS